jgi:hypothetical protein
MLVLSFRSDRARPVLHHEGDSEASHFDSDSDNPHDAIKWHVWGTRQSRRLHYGGFAVFGAAPENLFATSDEAEEP